jgi:glycosyltransferase involved in cell wall biosynthesis
LLRGAAILRERGVSFELLIAGPDEADYGVRMRTLAADLNLGEMVRFLGPVVGAEKVSLYQHADLFVLPSSQENFGFVFFEALAAGTAVLTTKSVDTWEELVGAGGSEAFEMSQNRNEAPSQVAEAIERMLVSRERLGEMGQRGRAWVMEHLEAERVISRYLTAYARASERGR